MKDEEQKDDEMRSEYDFSKLKLVGRGIYAERYRAGVKFVIRPGGDRVRDNQNDRGDGEDRER